MTQALIHAMFETFHPESRPRSQNLLDATTGLVFLGTPFRGTKCQALANLLQGLCNLQDRIAELSMISATTSLSCETGWITSAGYKTRCPCPWYVFMSFTRLITGKG